MQNKQARWPWVVGTILMVGVGVWLFRPRPEVASVAPRESAIARTQTPMAKAGLPAAPIVEHPIASEAAADAAIPALADSDDAAWSALSGVLGNEAALGILLRDHLVQRLVVLVDNLPQRSVPPSVLPYRPLHDPIRTVGEAGAEAPAELDAAANASRYAPYVAAFTHADPAALAAAYRRFYPLFQQAYVELGYPQGYFNDRLVQVIDHLLQTPELAQPPRVEPNGRGRYRFSDPALESLSVGQKALLRLAPEQAVAVKRQLRAIRAAITAG